MHRCNKLGELRFPEKGYIRIHIVVMSYEADWVTYHDNLLKQNCKLYFSTINTYILAKTLSYNVVG